MIKKLPVLFLFLFAARCAVAQSAEAQIRANRAVSNAAIARHDADGIVRDMLKDYSNDSLAWETGQWFAQHSYSGGGNYAAMWRKTGNAWKLAPELFVSLEK